MSKLKCYNGTSWEDVNGQITGDTLPIGSIIPYGSTTAPVNWLVCDGSYVSKDTYSELYAVVGDSFLDGGTAPTGTFRLPNYKGRVPVGYDPNDTDFNSIGKTGGEKTHTLTTDEVPPFSVRFTTARPGPTQGGWYDGQYLGYGSNEDVAQRDYSQKISTNYLGQAHNNVQPNQVSNYIIKAKQSAGLIGNVTNTYSNSQTDTYSCYYMNVFPKLQDIYPVGSYYKTSDLTFNPNTAWGGTWVEEVKDELVANCYYNFGTMVYSNNISSIQRTGLSTWYVTFTNQLKDANFTPVLSAERSGTGTEVIGVYSKGKNGFYFDMVDINGTTYTDNNMEVNIAVFGKLDNPTSKTWKRTA